MHQRALCHRGKNKLLFNQLPVLHKDMSLLSQVYVLCSLVDNYNNVEDYIFLQTTDNNLQTPTTIVTNHFFTQ